jgi:pimeloyl-ACP methyl ester carboxylesterase
MFFLFRTVTAFISLVILGVAAWLLWSWYAGEVFVDADGVLHRVRDDWRLWLGGALLLWSFLGRPLVLLLIGGRERDAPSAKRPEGHMLTSPTGSVLHVETWGPSQAPTVILTHGWGLDGAFWRYAVRALQDRFRLVVWDLPGLGRSRARKGAEVSLDIMARDLAAVIEDAGAGRCVLVGHSIGGMTIQTLLRERPDLEGRIAGIALFNTTFTNPLRTMVFSDLLTAMQRPVIEPFTRLSQWLWPVAWVSAWQSYLSGWAHVAIRLGFGSWASRDQLDKAALAVTRNSPEVQARGNLAMFAWDSREAIAGTTAPVLVVGGEVDIVTKAEASQAIARMASRPQLVLVPGANHMGPQGKAETYNALLADFVLSVQSGAGDAPPRTGRARSGSKTRPVTGASAERLGPSAV